MMPCSVLQKQGMAARHSYGATRTLLHFKCFDFRRSALLRNIIVTPGSRRSPKPTARDGGGYCRGLKNQQNDGPICPI